MSDQNIKIYLLKGKIKPCTANEQNDKRTFDDQRIPKGEGSSRKGSGKPGEAGPGDGKNEAGAGSRSEVRELSERSLQE